MRSESSKTLKSGFDLNEQELRRIYDVLVQQMERANTPESPDLVVTFEVKFRNGVIAEPTSLDEILDFENIGSGKIEKLKIRLQKGLESAPTSIFLEFIDIDSDSEIGNDSISYSITGNDRDWVFISDLTVSGTNIDRQRKSGKVVLSQTISSGGSNADQRNLSYLDSANL